MALTDRIGPLCDILLGAAYADDEFKDPEDSELREMLVDLSGTELTTDLEQRISTFDPAKFDIRAAAEAFRGDPADDRRRLLFLVAAIHDADDEIDFAEDEYLRQLCSALDLPSDALAGLTLDIEVEELRDSFTKVRRGPPPLPQPKRDGSVDVDV
jgi:tellurite resistance protein